MREWYKLRQVLENIHKKESNSPKTGHVTYLIILVEKFRWNLSSNDFGENAVSFRHLWLLTSTQPRSIGAKLKAHPFLGRGKRDFCPSQQEAGCGRVTLSLSRSGTWKREKTFVRLSMPFSFPFPEIIFFITPANRSYSTKNGWNVKWVV